MSSVSQINVASLFALYLRLNIMHYIILIYFLKVEIYCGSHSLRDGPAALDRFIGESGLLLRLLLYDGNFYFNRQDWGLIGKIEIAIMFFNRFCHHIGADSMFP